MKEVSRLIVISFAFTVTVYEARLAFPSMAALIELEPSTVAAPDVRVIVSVSPTLSDVIVKDAVSFTGPPANDRICEAGDAVERTTVMPATMLAFSAAIDNVAPVEEATTPEAVVAMRRRLLPASKPMACVAAAPFVPIVVVAAVAPVTVTSATGAVFARLEAVYTSHGSSSCSFKSASVSACTYLAFGWERWLILM